MKKKGTRLLSLLLSLVMVLGMLPAVAHEAHAAPVTTDKVYTYERIDSVDDIIPGKHFIIVAEYTNEVSGETSYHALGAKMAFYEGTRQAYRQDSDEYYGVGKTFEISADKNTITTYYNDTNYEHNYKNDYSINEPEHGILRLRFEAEDLSLNRYRFAVDGHGYMYGFTRRGNDGTAGHHLHAKMPIDTYTSGESWWQLSVGSNGYWHIATYTTYGSWDGRITGYELMRSKIYPFHGISATEAFPTGIGIESIPEENTGILLYMETECNHYIDTVTHTPGKPANCTTPGIRENWYCSDCQTYYADENMTTVIEAKDVLITPPAHSDSCGCAAETLKFELCLDPPSGSNQSGERYLLLATAGGKYYAMGNVTNSDGSRNAVEVFPSENGIVTASSLREEFMTYYWPDSGPIGFLVDNGYLSMQNGRILAYDQSMHDFNKLIPDQADFYLQNSYDETGLGSFRVWSSINKAYEYIVFDEEALCFRAQSTKNDSTYLYRELCPHEKEHYSGVEATCTRCGSLEYWYCDTCYRYFGDAEGQTTLERRQLTTHASGHDYQNGACVNCGKNVPVYSKVTSEDKFGLPGTYIVVATDGTNTYVLQEPYNTEADLDNTGRPDLYEIDTNGNGTPDVVEGGFFSDSDGDGEADIIDYDYEAPHVIPVTPDSNGNITVVGLGAAEFEMIPADFGYGEGGVPMPEALENIVDLPEDEEGGDEPVYDEYTDRYFLWMPNGLLNGLNHPNTRFTCFINGEGLLHADETSAWEMSLGSGLTAEDAAELTDAKFTVSNDTAIMFYERAANALRLRKYNDALSFVSGWDGYLIGATEILNESGNVIGYDTHDTQYGVYLYYAPDTFSHVHQWSDWTDTGDGETHARTCSADNCAVSTQSASHRWREGRVLKAPTCTEEGQRQMICTDCGARKTAAIPARGHDWGDWTYSDETAHIRSCTRDCGAVSSPEAHSWGDELEWVDDEYHARVCSVCDGQLKGEHNWGEMQISSPATCQQSGLGWIGCTICERGSLEVIPQLDHEFGDWTKVDEETHSRSCTYECGTTETGDHEWIVEVIQAPSCIALGQTRQYCPLCNDEQLGEMPIDPDAHNWGEWTVTRLPSVGIEGEEQRVCANAPTEHVETKRLPAIALPMEDTTISFVASYDIPQTVSVHAYEVDLAHDGIADGDPTVGQEVAPYEEYILNGLDGKKVETVFEIQPVVTENDTTLPYEVPAGQSFTVTLFVGEANAAAMAEHSMYLVHITTDGTTTYYTEDDPNKPDGAPIVTVLTDENGVTGYVTFSADSFSPFVLVSLPGENSVKFNAAVSGQTCTVSFTEANQSFLCNLFIAVYDSSDRMLAVKSAGNVNLAANPQYTLEFSGTASYVKAFMLTPDGSLIPRCETELDDVLND